MRPQRLAAAGRVPRSVDRTSWVHIRPDQVRADFWRVLDALVLFDEALAELSPSAIAKSLLAYSGEVILAPEAIGYEPFAEWISSGLRRVVPVVQLPGYLERLGPVPISALPPEGGDGLPVARTAAGQAFLTTLRQESGTRPGVFARQLGWSRHRLRRVCLEEFGESPDAIVKRWTFARVRALRLQGASVEQAAHLVGYSETSALYRALRNARGPMPARGSAARSVDARRALGHGALAMPSVPSPPL